MPDWKFLLASHYAGAQQRRAVCEAIKEHVEQLGLSTVLPLVKFETGKSREYYLGIAFDQNIPDAVDNACRVLAAARITKVFAEPQDPEAIRSFLRGTLDCASFTIPLSYEKESDTEPVSSNQLLSLADIGELQPFDIDMPITDYLDKLLYWCSSTGAGDLGRIQNTCQLLGLSTEWGGAWSVIRRFVLLGHLEFDMRNTIRWGVVPSVLIRTATDSGHFLSGQRSPSLVSALHENFRITENTQIGGPKQLVVEGINKGSDVTLESSRRLKNLDCVSARLSKILPTVEQWAKAMPAWSEKDFGRYQIEHYIPERDEFLLLESLIKPQKGFYRFKLENNNRKSETLTYFDDEYGNWTCGDFYGLRFLARRNMGVCRAVYLDTKSELLIPVIDRWPMPYERALVLASGILPHRLKTESGLNILSYIGISRELAAQLCGLLGLEMEGE